MAHILITTGNTQAPIDKVRCLTNIFTGRTGARIATTALRRGHQVTLLTSHPQTIAEIEPNFQGGDRWRLCKYHTYQDLAAKLTEEMTTAGYEIVIHAAAVSDYLCSGVYAVEEGARFDTFTKVWSARAGLPRMEERTGGKVKSDDPELWLRLTRAPKLVDRFRGEWGFHGILVKFKLEVEKSDEELLTIAENSRLTSAADFMVANTLEGAAHWAFLGPIHGRYERIDRPSLAERLLLAVEEALERNRDGKGAAGRDGIGGGDQGAAVGDGAA